MWTGNFTWFLVDFSSFLPFIQWLLGSSVSSTTSSVVLWCHSSKELKDWPGVIVSKFQFISSKLLKCLAVQNLLGPEVGRCANAVLPICQETRLPIKYKGEVFAEVQQKRMWCLPSEYSLGLVFGLWVTSSCGSPLVQQISAQAIGFPFLFLPPTIPNWSKTAMKIWRTLWNRSVTWGGGLQEAGERWGPITLSDVTLDITHCLVLELYHKHLLFNPKC